PRVLPGSPELDKVRALPQCNRVLAGEARRAVALAAVIAGDRAHHALVREVPERVARDVAVDLLDRVRCRDQLAARRRIDAVVAGVRRRWRTDAQVHFLGAGRTQHLDDLARRRAAHERVIDDDDALAV